MMDSFCDNLLGEDRREGQMMAVGKGDRELEVQIARLCGN
jgi:hypothetical protein